MNKLFLLFAAAAMLAACNNDPGIGGDCIYEDSPFKATVVSIQKDTMSLYDKQKNISSRETYLVKLTTDIPKYDSLELDYMLGRDVTKEFLDKHQLREGMILNGTASLITSGTCVPATFQFEDSTLHATN